MDAHQLIEHYNMIAHPEGGYYVETYKSSGIIDASALPIGWGNHSYSTAIYFLLREKEYSHLHRIRQDEMWHFYLGDSLRIVIIHENGRYEEIILGQDVLNGQVVQCVVPAGAWFGATPETGSRYSFVGCTVAPGFEFSDFELATTQELEQSFPQHKEKIKDFIIK